ncbi:hypothetical protein Daudx_0840 [Candidatus Desulforudis audaxviator]|nr:hypothetical protein Daudx_0840 [Candidatus Desulforudis audaxviator]
MARNHPPLPPADTKPLDPVSAFGSITAEPFDPAVVSGPAITNP